MLTDSLFCFYDDARRQNLLLVFIVTWKNEQAGKGWWGTHHATLCAQRMLQKSPGFPLAAAGDNNGSRATTTTAKDGVGGKLCEKPFNNHPLARGGLDLI